MAKKTLVSEMTEDEIEDLMTGPVEDAVEELRSVVDDLERVVTTFGEWVTVLARHVVPAIQKAAPSASGGTDAPSE